ncbi:hypothetical protein A374_17869 [Fictibacillus macauensis ZFHKF-1]|uniref:DNA alkylation repair protein n=1 Tax=Fictibacillus macauensis ZFHKF-1 TaxID=1196324 RepID=I8AEA8_9BACL|nr:DNA alkylation repair protein [Fictibacillus macauensis]EIT83927.1 hypothetical protein A374_17869 [Fictibacillus macauensis ZFHKF-1]
MDYIEALYEEVRGMQNPAEAVKMASYMKNKFTFAGLRAPILNHIVKKHVKMYGRPDLKIETVVKKCWGYQLREMQYIGLYVIDLLKKDFQEEDLTHLEYIVTKKSWWDTIDHIAKHHLGHYVQSFPETKNEVIERWINASNMWMNRSAILHQLSYKERTDEERLTYVIEKKIDDPEFFIRKAIGWALREYAKTNPDWVRTFVEKHPDLSPLSRKEALKHIK